MFTREQSKVTLKSRGWSYRRAAKKLKVSYQHLSEVLNGHRESRRLLVAISRLPICPDGPVSNRRQEAVA
jgi:transcriptional regulator with XRE-family HTH domain